MFKNYKFWFKTGSWALLVTGLLHSLSLINKPVPGNDTERQLIELMTTYKLEGVDRTMYELFFFFSLCLTMFSLFTASLNLLFAKYYIPSGHDRKYIAATLIFWTIFLVPLCLLTFIVPIVCYAICWLFFLVAFLMTKK